MARIFVADKLGEAGLNVLRARHDVEPIVETGLSEDELCTRIGGADALIVRSATKVTPKVLEAGTDLRIVGRAGIGVDNIDLDAATERGVLVVNTPDANATTTAELAVAHMLSLSRNLPAADRSVREGKWERSRFVGAQLAGKTCGVVGFGTIGRLVAQRCRGLGMRVLAYDPFVTTEQMEKTDVVARDLESLLAEADYVTLHCPKTDSTRRLFDAERLRSMKRGARLINCARGGLIDEDALAETLASGHLAGAALDVFEQEPPEESKLLGAENVNFTPHLGASTREAQDAVAIEIVEQILDYLDSGVIKSAVNIRATRGGEDAESRAHQRLTRRLARLLSALAPFAVSELTLSLSGRAARLGGDSLQNEALAGFLGPRLESTRVNLVNAARLAERQGIRVVEAHAERGSSLQMHTLVEISARGEGKSVSVAGTLLADRHPRLAAVGGTPVEAVLDGVLILTRHEDRPGVIGELGTILGGVGVNIMRMHVGAMEGGGLAVGVLAVERALDGAELERLKKIEAIEELDQVDVSS